MEHIHNFTVESWSEGQHPDTGGKIKTEHLKCECGETDTVVTRG